MLEFHKTPLSVVDCQRFSNLHKMSAARLFSQAVRQLRPLQPTLAASRPKVMRSSLVIRAMSSDGQITSELVQRMQTKIQDALQAQKVEVADVAGDGRHVEIFVIAKEFEGKSAVNRQRMVYKVRISFFHEICRSWRHFESCNNASFKKYLQTNLIFFLMCRLFGKSFKRLCMLWMPW